VDWEEHGLPALAETGQQWTGKNMGFLIDKYITTIH
jgi:hypothetical protein